jgi:hypothetical protein
MVPKTSTALQVTPPVVVEKERWITALATAVK